MALSKEKKKEIIKKLEKNIEEQKIMLFVNIAKIKTKDILDLKRRLKEKGNILTVAKKTLFQLATKNKNISIDVKEIKGEMAVIFGNKDEVSAANIIEKFSKENENLKILGGIFEKKLINKEKVVMLASIPSREELLTKLVYNFKSPVFNLVSVLKANLKSLVYLLSNIKK